MDDADRVLIGLCIALLAVISIVHSRWIAKLSGDVAKLRNDVEFGLIVARETKEAG